MPKSLSVYLDLIRLLAALLVFIVHANYQGFTGGLPVLWRLGGLGNDAVMVFFVLSGFVLSHAYGWDLASKTGGPAFLLKRVIRLYPLYILGSALSLVGYLAIWITWHAWGSVPDFFTSLVAAVFFLPDFMRTGGIAVLVLVIVGGVLYSVGGVIYGLKRPDPSPRWFGFHEVFHSLTLAAFITHYVGISLVAYQHA